MTVPPGTEISYDPPPRTSADEDGDERPATRVGVHVSPPDDSCTDAAVLLVGADAADPDRIADALIRSTLGVAATLGPDQHWATVKALRDFGDPS